MKILKTSFLGGKGMQLNFHILIYIILAVFAIFVFLIVFGEGLGSIENIGSDLSEWVPII